MTTKPMSNHKPYLRLSRRETSLYLEAFVKHTRFMHALVGFFPEAAILAAGEEAGLVPKMRESGERSTDFPTTFMPFTTTELFWGFASKRDVFATPHMSLRCN